MRKAGRMAPSGGMVQVPEPEGATPTTPTKDHKPMSDALPTERPYLSPTERRYLWLLSQGHGVRETQRLMGLSASPNVGTRTREKLNAKTTAQALYHLALLDLIGPFEFCGTMKGYRFHHGRHEDACRACRRAFIEFTERQPEGFSALRRPQLTEPEARYLRAMDAGRTIQQIADNWGLTRRAVDPVRASLYRKLDVAHLPLKHRRAAALEEGRRHGFLKQEELDLPTIPRSRTVYGLTDLEVRTLAAVDGRSLSEAGRIFGIPGSSVSARLARIYTKLGVLHHPRGERRAAALKEARNRGYPL